MLFYLVTKHHRVESNQIGQSVHITGEVLQLPAMAIDNDIEKTEKSGHTARQDVDIVIVLQRNGVLSR